MAQTPPSARANSHPRRAVALLRGLAIAMGLIAPIVLFWFGAAAIVAHKLKFPTVPAYSPDGTPVLVKTVGPFIPSLRDFLDAPSQRIAIRRPDAATLPGLLVPGTHLRDAVVLVCPNQSSPWSTAGYYKVIHAAGYTTLIIDYADSHRREGWGWDERHDVLDAAAAARRWGAQRVAVMGVSEGAAAALFAADYAPFAAVISDSSYANLRRFLERVPPMDSLNPLFLHTVLWEVDLRAGRPVDEIEPVRAAARMRGRPLMVINGDQDPLVPPADARAIYAAAKGPKELWIVPDAGHAGALAIQPKQYAQRVAAFLNKYLGAPPPSGKMD